MNVSLATVSGQRRKHATHEADDHALDHERPADEPVRGPHQLHDLHLAAAHSRMVLAIGATEAKIEQRGQAGGQDLDQPRWPTRILSVSDSLLRTSSSPASEATRSPEASRGASLSTMAFTLSGSSGTIRKVSGSGLPPSSLEPSANASGFFFLACFEALGLGDELHRLHVGEALQRAADLAALRRRGVGLHVGVDHDAVAHLVRGAGGGLDDRDEHAEHERGEHHGQQRGQRGRGVTTEAAQGLAEEEAKSH